MYEYVQTTLNSENFNQKMQIAVREKVMNETSHMRGQMDFQDSYKTLN